MLRKVGAWVGGLSLLAGLSGAAAADYVFSAPPREDAQAAQSLYGPLAEHLSALLGEKVVYEYPGDWRNYERKMRAGEYDILFDGPHFAAWRIEKGMSQPLVKLPGKLDFVLVVRNDQDVKSEQDLVGKRVCVLPSPNLTAMTAYAMFPNAMRQPQFIPVKGGNPELADKIVAGGCIAGVMRTSFFEKKLDPTQRASLRILTQSKALTNQGITVSNRVDADSRRKLVASLTHGDGRKAAEPVLHRFSGNAKNFEAASADDYSGQNLLKQNMLYGW